MVNWCLVYLSMLNCWFGVWATEIWICCNICISFALLNWSWIKEHRNLSFEQVVCIMTLKIAFEPLSRYQFDHLKRPLVSLITILDILFSGMMLNDDKLTLIVSSLCMSRSTLTQDHWAPGLYRWACIFVNALPLRVTRHHSMPLFTIGMEQFNSRLLNNRRVLLCVMFCEKNDIERQDCC